MYTENAWTILCEQRLAKQILIEHFIDQTNRVESVEVLKTSTCFEREIIVENQKQALHEVKKYCTGCVLWIDGSKHHNGNTEADVR